MVSKREGIILKIHFDAVTPAQLYFEKNIISNLKKKHDILLTIRPKKTNIKLVEELGVPYKVIGKYRTNKVGKIISAFSTTSSLAKKMNHFNPDICFGQLYMIYAARIKSKPSIIFEDDEVTTIQQFFYTPFANVIFTPYMFRTDFGEKHVKIKGYKELSYLHPNYFKPDKRVLNELNIDKNDRYIILRWNTWDAIHDVSKSGFNKDFILEIIKQIEEYAQVFISTERELPLELEKYKINIPFSKIHHVLYYAHLLVSDTQTMSTEAAVLGTPAIRCNSFVGPNDMSNFIELEEKYGLIFNYTSKNEALEHALELIQKPDIKREWTTKKEVLLKDKIDVTAFISWFIDNYPESLEIMKENPEYQEKFK